MHDFPFKGVRDYLDKMGFYGRSREEIEEAKKNYWKLYQHYYQKEYRERMKKIQLAFSFNEITLLHELAEQKDQTIQEFLRDSVLKAMEGEYTHNVFSDALTEVKRVRSELVNTIRNCFKKEAGSSFVCDIHHKLDDFEKIIRRWFE